MIWRPPKQPFKEGGRRRCGARQFQPLPLMLLARLGTAGMFQEEIPVTTTRPLRQDRLVSFRRLVLVKRSRV